MPDTASDLAYSSRLEARAGLNRVVKLLKRAGVSQNELARSAGYSPGYVTQLLSDKYPVEKLSPAAIVSLITSAYGHARTVRRLSAEDARELGVLLDELATGFSAARPEVFGMDGGESLDREAANYMNSDLDQRLAEDVEQHAGYGFVQVVGSPGQGKTWALAHLELRAKLSHEVCWVDFDRLESTDELSIPPHAFVGTELRRYHQRYFRTLEIQLHRHGQGRDSGSAQERLERALQGVVAEHPQLAERQAMVADILERVLDDTRTAALHRPGEVLAGAEARQAIELADRYVNDVDPNRYIADDLADDLGLLVALVDAIALLDPDSAEAAHKREPRKLLILIDAADRSRDPSHLTQLLRELKTLSRFNPELRRVLVIVSKTIASASSSATKSSSTSRRWYPAEPFTGEDVLELIARLRDHGWFRDSQLTGNDDELLRHCKLLSQFNRRATCLYLDHVQSTQRLIDIDKYLGDRRGADTRARRWVERWAQHIVRDLNALIERSPSDPQDKFTREGVLEWCRWASAKRFRELEHLPLEGYKSSVLADEFCMRYGLLVDGEVRYLQRRVAARIVELTSSGDGDVDGSAAKDGASDSEEGASNSAEGTSS